MARRRRRYGEVHLKRRSAKIDRLYARKGGGGGKSRKVGIKVFIQRQSYDVGRSGYTSRACPMSASNRAVLERGGQRCGPLASGPTPTRAVENALKALVTSHALRKGGR